MPEENQPTNAEPTAAPAQETDWKAEARKWEQRAKENRREADSLREKADLWDEMQRGEMTEAQRATERAERAEAELERLRADAQRRADADEVSAATGVPARILLHCGDRDDMERLADEFSQEARVPAAAPAPQTRVIRGDGAKPRNRDRFAAMLGGD